MSRFPDNRRAGDDGDAAATIGAMDMRYFLAGKGKAQGVTMGWMSFPFDPVPGARGYRCLESDEWVLKDIQLR